MKRQILLVLVSIWLTNAAQAADIASGARTGIFNTDSTDGGYFEIGASAVAINNFLLSRDDFEDFGLGLIIGGEYRYKGFFVESIIGSADGLNLGFNLYNSERLSVDFLATSISGTISDDDNDLSGTLAETDRNDAIRNRDTIYNGAGIRLTGYTPDQNRIVQFRLVTDIYNGNGLTATLRTSKTQQWKNWVFHSIFSLGYLSGETSQYLFGINQDIATERYPEFDIGSNWTVGAEAGVTYPINENWVFRTTLRGQLAPSRIKDSPLVSDNFASSIAATITYVF